ncbi:MAG: hypothetical protein GTO17_10685 [Candidatus Aminicenantes bacterium]|nr:hypothetical protein [Candidatus Aminicenantes bacterium]
MKKPISKESSVLQSSPLFEEEDIFADLAEKKGTSLFLGKYSLNEVFAVLRKRSFLSDARKRKLWPLVFEMDSSEFPLQRFQIFYKEKKPDNAIVDLKIKEGTFQPKKDLVISAFLKQSKFLILDWLTLQNPLQDFTPERPPLPGQKYPGLSLGKKVIDIFIYLARLTRNDGLLAYPAYFHNALLFLRYFNFLNPEKEAEVITIRKSFPEVTFKQLAWIVHLGCLKDQDDKIYAWEAEEQVYPINRTLRSYLDSKDYKKRVKEAQKDIHFRIDWECFERKSKQKD